MASYRRHCGEECSALHKMTLGLCNEHICDCLVRADRTHTIVEEDVEDTCNALATEAGPLRKAFNIRQQLMKARVASLRVCYRCRGLITFDVDVDGDVDRFSLWGDNNFNSRRTNFVRVQD